MDDWTRAKLDRIEGYFGAIASQDADRVATFYTEDYVLELPYYKPNEPMTVEGREAVREYLRALLPAQFMELRLLGAHAVRSESLVIAEYTSEGRFTETGLPYANRYVGYFFFEGDLIRRLREYYNPQVSGASAID